jgi:hypothetical protein
MELDYGGTSEEVGNPTEEEPLTEQDEESDSSKDSMPTAPENQPEQAAQNSQPPRAVQVKERTINPSSQNDIQPLMLGNQSPLVATLKPTGLTPLQ